MAYQKEDSGIEEKEYVNDHDYSNEEKREAYFKYETLFEQIREFVYKECDATQIQLVRDYCDNLRILSGDVLWGFYKEVFPEFFAWVDSLE